MSDIVESFEGLQAPSETVALAGGTIRVLDVGEGRPVVFVHGLMVNGRLWRHVVPAISARARCVVPDLPLGGHSPAMMPDADLSPPGLARLIAELLDRLDLRDVVLVGNDTGGALCQLVVAHHGERVGALVLTNCDGFEQFYPAVLRPLR